MGSAGPTCESDPGVCREIDALQTFTTAKSLTGSCLFSGVGLMYAQSELSVRAPPPASAEWTPHSLAEPSQGPLGRQTWETAGVSRQEDFVLRLH